MRNFSASGRLFSQGLILVAGLSSITAIAQDQPTVDDNSTVTYPAAYFDQYNPFSVTDMLDRIPGINVARPGGNDNNGPGNSRGSQRRGLGLGGDQVLINGRRITGKENEGNSQLSRIPANQVQYIEIIRGTSGELEVRGGNQVINIVLLEAESRSTVAYEINSDRYHDGELKPGGKISLTGQQGAFDYLLSAESEPRWEYRVGFEKSIFADGTANELVRRLSTRDSQPLTITANLGYRLGDNDRVHFNFQYDNNDAPVEEDRIFIDQLAAPPSVAMEFDNADNSSDFWEIGGDYAHTFSSGASWKTLFIANEKEDDSTRERFEVGASDLNKDLFLHNFNRYQERIARTSYSFGLTASQDLEVRIERAQTILDSTLKLGLLPASDALPVEFGGLTPVTNANARVEEIRYEAFVIHNWQINERMSLESTLIIENSEIEQSGDINKKRDFDFIRPKLDYRFDITPSLQFKATIQKDVSQLSFNDFTANVNDSDDDQDAVAGNPDLRQEQSWRYELNLEYRFNNDYGVVNANLFYHDLEDVIDKVDVSTATSILSANGNIGDGRRYGLNANASMRLGFMELPGILVTAGIQVEIGRAHV